jgi:hypothetical protein
MAAMTRSLSAMTPPRGFLARFDARLVVGVDAD